MSYLRLVFFSMIILSYSCNKEGNTDDPKNEDPEDEVQAPVFEMEIDGIIWGAEDFYYKKEKDLHVIFGTDLSYSVRWDIEIIAPNVPYVLGKNENKLISSFYRYIDNKPQSYIMESGELIIEEFDIEKKLLKGRFSFDASYQAKDIKITNGKFVIKDF